MLLGCVSTQGLALGRCPGHLCSYLEAAGKNLLPSSSNFWKDSVSSCRTESPRFFKELLAEGCSQLLEAVRIPCHRDPLHLEAKGGDFLPEFLSCFRPL